MQTIQKRFSVVAGFILLLIVLVANALITRRQVSEQVSSQAQVSHTEQILLELTQTESLLKDAETGQRGYLYTDDPRYLTPYIFAISQVEPHIDNLERLTADNPRQQAHVPVLRGLARGKLKELATTIFLYRSGKPDEAKALVVSDAGLNLMIDIRKEIEEMEQGELSLQARRTAAYQKSVRMTVASIYLASVVAALGLVLLAFYILREMNLRERHARQMRQREEWFRVTLTSLGDAVIATDRNGLVTFLNPVAERLIGTVVEHATGKVIDEIFPIFNEYTLQPVENPVKKVLEAGRTVGLANHTVLRHSNGTLIPIEDSAAPIHDDRDKLVGVVLVFRDASQERKSQEILRKTEKLAAAGRLAATVAHEINNPLEAVGNLIYIARVEPNLPAAAIQALDLAEQELERVSHITRQTLGFYRESNEPAEVEVPAVIEYVLRLYSNKFETKNITVECDFRECPSIQGLRGELTQAISNLISNAADAVGLQGAIRVHLSCVEESDRKWVQLRIEDDGPGVAPELIERIFEPFFTTKKDVGTGLGLWVTREIIHRHGGTIHVVPAVGEGSGGAAFNVMLPCPAGL
jgi:PAS domain S-box-containing protein